MGEDVIRKIKNTVFSKLYQDIKNSNLEEIYKKILLMDLISKYDMQPFLNINQIWLNYYESIDNEEKKQYYLQKRIKEIPDGYSYNADVRYGESGIKFSESYRQKAMYISTNEVLTDLNRRAGNFDEVKRLAEYVLKTYEFTNIKDPLKVLYQYQLELIEAQDKRHL